jgi:excisionase family DNA binding protein
MTMLVQMTQEDLEAAIERVVAKVLTRIAAPPLDVLDSKGAGELVGKSSRVMERQARAGNLPAFRHGKTWRFKRTDVEAWASRPR